MQPRTKRYTVAVEQGSHGFNCVKSGESVPFIPVSLFIFVVESIVSRSIEDNEGNKCGEGKLAFSVLVSCRKYKKLKKKLKIQKEKKTKKN
ncbi:hypothetical protein Hanom_Chr11g01041021 [Helianthus anomalus]